MLSDTPPSPAVDKTVEVKVVVAAIVTLLAGVVVGILNAVQADNTVLAGLPPWLQFVILAAAPPALSFFGGYWKASNRVDGDA